MDQIKIGKFIAEERKRIGCTQKQLAEKLEISDKTVSKWECGKGFPEVSLLIPLCKELDITVNELLSGERVAEEDYRKKAEENMMKLVEEKQENKKRLVLATVVMWITLIAALTLFVLPGLVEMRTWLRILLIVIGFIVLVGGIAVCCVVDKDAGAFECPECGERFNPTMKEYIKGAHTFTKRRLTCPACGARKYCKKVLSHTK